MDVFRHDDISPNVKAQKFSCPVQAFEENTGALRVIKDLDPVVSGERKLMTMTRFVEYLSSFDPHAGILEDFQEVMSAYSLVVDRGTRVSRQKFCV